MEGVSEDEEEGEEEEEEEEECETVRVREGRGEEVEKMKAGKDERIIKKMADPHSPTQQDVEDHNNRAHLPYQN